MGFTYTWQQEGCDPVSANYDSLEEALAQAEHDANIPGAPAPIHVLDEDGVVATAWKDATTFAVIGAGEVVESKPEPEHGDEGVFVVVQEPMQSEELAAYAEALVNG